MTETVAYIGIGSNLDDPARQVRDAIEALAHVPATRRRGVSRLYRTAPWGKTAQPDFVNAAVALATTLEPKALLDALLAIERRQGRRRDGTRWAPRRIDLDMLVYGDRHINEPGLRIPHPYIAERAFVLLPLADLDPDLNVPGRGRVRELLEKVDASACVALAGAPTP